MYSRLIYLRIFTYCIYKEHFYLLTGSTALLHGDQCIASCEVHMNFSDDSACLTDKNIWKEVVPQITRGVENAVPLHVDILHN
jgi:hypothetical protein